jgi:uncharacterized membrane protein
LNKKLISLEGIGAHLHGFLTKFPVVFALLLLGVELFRKETLSSKECQIAYGALSGSLLSAFLSGYLANAASKRTFTPPETLIAWHYNLGRLALFFSLILLVTSSFKGSSLAIRRTRLLLLCIVTLAVLSSGYTGGEAIFRYGAGVFATK